MTKSIVSCIDSVRKNLATENQYAKTNCVIEVKICSFTTEIKQNSLRREVNLSMKKKKLFQA